MEIDVSTRQDARNFMGNNKAQSSLCLGKNISTLLMNMDRCSNQPGSDIVIRQGLSTALAYLMSWRDNF